jgi:hypothetical protein
MVRTRVVLLSVLASFVLTAAAASAVASAHELRVNGRKVKAASFSGTESGTKNTLKGTPLGVSVRIECTHRQGKGSVLQVSPGVWQIEGSGELTSCVVAKPANCSVSEPITTRGDGEFEENAEGQIELDTSSEAGKPYTEITLAGASCSLKGKPVKVEGSQKCLLPEAKVEAVRHEAVCEATGSALTAGGKAATFESSPGTDEIEGGEYENGEKFGAGEPFDVI